MTSTATTAANQRVLLPESKVLSATYVGRQKIAAYKKITNFSKEHANNVIRGLFNGKLNTKDGQEPTRQHKTWQQKYSMYVLSVYSYIVNIF
jgi:hypothetical protein